MMKSNLSTLILLFFSFVLFAQSQKKEHLSFKGVPIDGTLTQYVLKMKQGGFVHTNTQNGIAFLKGDFAGYKNCYVGVSTLKAKDLVHKIAVIFPQRETWSTLSGNYFELKDMLTEKYGKPSDVVEKFDNASPDDDHSKMYEVGFDRCKYSSIWRTNNGEIELAIHHDGITRYFVRLMYFDKINNEVIRAKAKDDL